MRRTLLIVFLLILPLVLVGCLPGTNVTSVRPLTLDEVAGRRLVSLTTEERERSIFEFVANRIIVDKDRLITIPGRDLVSITRLLSNVNEFLKGVRNDALSDSFGNYLLKEFSTTPFEWEQTRVTPVGFDPAARLYFVDVTYNTTWVRKTVIPDSRIASGSPHAELLKQKRYEDYIAYLSAKTAGNLALAGSLRQSFTNTWGTIESVMVEQQGLSLLDRTRAFSNATGGIGKLTYSGLVSDPKLATAATMTLRYVMRYRFNLGEETDLFVKAVYLKDFSLQNADALINSYTLVDPVGSEVLKPFIDRLINSYHRAVESTNHIGLYQLFDNYGSVDKFYMDARRYAILATGDYTFRVLARAGTHLNVLVNRVNRIRARGTDMSLPTYDETLIFNLVLSPDDRIRVHSVFPVKRTLVGEPISVIRSVTGVSDLIHFAGVAFTESNRVAVEETIKNFSAVVLAGDVGNPRFIELMDRGVSRATLTRVADTITAINANRKITYIISWDTRTNVYVSLTLRGIFETNAGNFDTEAVIDLVNRNGAWRVVNYTRTVNVRTEKVPVDTTNALSVDIRN